MTGSLASLGEPGGLTVINLTLGVDSDGDGIPDAWEETLIQSGVDASLASIVDVEPDGDADRDGLSNYTEYVAGTYAFDPNDVFALEILDADQVRYLLRFLAIRGRSYAIESSLSLDAGWEAAEFTLDDGLASSLARVDYYASSVEIVTVRVARNEPENSRFFRLVARQ